MSKSVDPKTGLVIHNPSDMFDPAPLAFSHLAVAPPGAQAVWVAGQSGGADKGDFADQTRVALSSIATAMQAAGGDINGVAKITVYIVDHNREKHRVLIKAVKAVFKNRLAPACTIVPLQQLGTDPKMLVEIEAFGIVPPRKSET
ncbi:RidA family protein [Gymnodinialimonas hymeniacidonis]|uniref:RidA family protein n=1 Tax=Gymnodinialimonas hymeniacidonis TaxID=3126508 RepID=UPI0034C69CD4